MYAVVRTGGKQYRVEPGFELLVEKLDIEPGKMLELKDVLLYSDGTSIEVGKPIVAATVHATVVTQELGDKVHTIKYRRRHTYKRTYGHRQSYTRLFIEKITKN